MAATGVGVIHGAVAIVEGASAPCAPTVLLVLMLVLVCRSVGDVVSLGRLDGDVAENHAPQLLLEGTGGVLLLMLLHGRASVCAVRRTWCLRVGPGTWPLLVLVPRVLVLRLVAQWLAAHWPLG